MKEYGQFDVIGYKKVELEFPCSNCGKMIKTEFPIRHDNHSDETVACNNCDKFYEITVMHDAGTGKVEVHSIDQKMVKAQGK